MKRIVIVGGGTAGWMCAIAFSKRFPQVEIVVLDPSTIAPIGVGESVTGVVQMFVKDPLHELDLGEFYRCTDATLKFGIWYKGWQGDGTDYLTPIDAPFDRFRHRYETAIEEFYALASVDSVRLGDAQLYSSLMRTNSTDFVYQDDQSISAKFAQPSCHFDAVMFAQWLRSIAPTRGNITHVDDVVSGFEMDEARKFVTQISTRKGQTITGDFFLDCTGFRRMLFQPAYNPTWIDYSKYIKVDRAIPCPVPYEGDQPWPNYTQATAARAGWMWQVPTQSRLGRGYLFSSKYVDDADAIAEMREAGIDPGDSPRVLEFKPGKFATQWEGNVCALGLAGGFIEALEASTIHAMYVQMQLLGDLFLPNYRKEAAGALSKRYNELLQVAYDDYVDFISFHYHTGRDDTPFWRDYQQADSMTDANRWRMEKWQYSYPTREDFCPIYTQRTMLTTGFTIWAPMLCAMGYLKPETARAYLQRAARIDLARANVENYIRGRQFIVDRAVPHAEAVQYLRGL